MLLPAHWFVSNIFSSDRGNPALPLPPFSQRASPSQTEKHKEMFVCTLETDSVSTWSSLCLSALSSAIRSALSSIWYFLFHPIFPLLLFSLDPSSIRSSLCLSISFSKTNLIYFRLSHHLLHFSLRFFLFQLLFSIPTFPPFPLSICLITLPTLPLPTPIPFMEKK